MTKRRDKMHPPLETIVDRVSRKRDMNSSLYTESTIDPVVNTHSCLS
jgi:hypothetical protein